MKRRRLSGASQIVAQGGLHHVYRCADNIARAVDRRMPEAGALAGWLDQSRGALGLADADDFADAPSRTTGISVLAWRRLRAAIARGLRAAPPVANSPAELWLETLTNRLDLDPIEREILALTLLYRQDERLERLVDRLSAARGGVSRLRCDAGLIALLLGQDPVALEPRLRPTGRLRASGLLHVDRDGDVDVIGRLGMLVRCATLPQADPFEQLLGRAVAPTLPWDAFDHLGGAATVAADILRAAVAGRETGVNILLYGPPGTGKTSFAATLAARIHAQLRPITEHDDEGHEPHRFERLAGLQLAQRLAPPGNTVLLFDEAEDLFMRDPNPRTAGSNSRVFIHRILERAAIPVIWTANDVAILGPAVARRMTMCLKLEIPGVAVRTRLWRNLAEAEGIALPEPEAAGLARLVPAAPALAATAMRATRLAAGDAATARLIVEGIARAVAGGHIATPPPERPDRYDPALVNADQDLPHLADRLCRADAPSAVSILLTGPPGSGKSAWARHLAERMGLDVLQKRASDLLGMYVGETEANIAQAFAEARQSRALLIFDEADSLLAERATAVRSWEVSQVNEMLTWMEQHPLPFVCTTNLPDRLDRASLRRFLVKLRFTWLTPAQARLAFTRFFDLPPPPALDALATLTPADFALVHRRATLTGQLHDPTALLTFLSSECTGREGAQRIGFR